MRDGEVNKYGGINLSGILGADKREDKFKKVVRLLLNLARVLASRSFLTNREALNSHNEVLYFECVFSEEAIDGIPDISIRDIRDASAQSVEEQKKGLVRRVKSVSVLSQASGRVEKRGKSECQEQKIH